MNWLTRLPTRAIFRIDYAGGMDHQNEIPKKYKSKGMFLVCEQVKRNWCKLLKAYPCILGWTPQDKLGQPLHGLKIN